MRRIWKRFNKGLRTRQLRVFPIAALMCAIVLVATEYCTRKLCFTMLPEEHLLLRWNDDYTHMLYDLKEISNEKLNPKIYLIGSSALRESVQGTGVFSRAISQSLQRPVTVHNLSTLDQTLGESMAIVDQLKSHSGVVVVGINPRRLNHSFEKIQYQLDRGRLLLLSPQLRSFMAHQGYRSLSSYFLSPNLARHLNRYLWTFRSDLLTMRAPRTQFRLPPRFRAARMKSYLVRKAMIERQIDRYKDRFAENFPFNLNLLEEVLLLSKKKGLRPVVVELPLNPEARDSLESLYADYRPQVRARIAELQVPYLEFMWQLPLHSNDFYDLHHLVEPGREKFQASFREVLLTHLLHAQKQV